jgi:hypothetical protein
MKERYITQPDDPAYKAFLDKWSSILRDFETSVVPYLAQADI